MSNHTATTLAGTALIWVLALLGIVIVQARDLQKLELRIASLESERTRTSVYQLTAESNARQFAEFQQWRVSVTLASRHGWGAANRYIANYPLWLPGEPIPDHVYPPEWETVRVFGDLPTMSIGSVGQP